MPCGCGSANGGNGTIVSAQIQERSIILNEQITGWNQLRNCDPKDPLNFIANAKLGDVNGTFLSSSTFTNSSPSWITTDHIRVSGTPVCSALQTEDNQKVADAAQWTFQHLTGPDSISGLAPQLYYLLFLRGGTQWKMRIALDMSVATFKDVQISLFENAATLGDCHGEIPVVSFVKNEPYFTGVVNLDLTLKMQGIFNIGFRAIDSENNWWFEHFLWVVVP